MVLAQRFLQLDMPNGTYSGHQLISAVNMGIIPRSPHHDLKYIPTAPTASPSMIRMILSVFPIFFFITVNFDIKQFLG